MTRTPPVNAKLTKVYSLETVSDGGGGFEETLIVKWQGTASAYATESNRIEAGSTGPVNIYVATLAIPSNVPVEVGDSVDYVRAGLTETREVDGTEDRSDLGYTRLFVKERA